MTQKNKISKPYLNLRMLAATLIVTACIVNNAMAQTRFTRTTFSAAYTPITVGSGATSSTATGDNLNQTGIPVGFSFGYGDSTFTTIGLSTNGVVWFDAIAPAVTVGHGNIIAASAPNQTLAPWCNNLIDDASSDILYQTQGSPGSRTFTVQYTNYPTYIGTPGSNVRMNCQVVLHETTNVIEFKYGTLNIIGGQTTSGGAMIGMEWGTGGNGKFIDAVTGSSSVSHKMLSPLSGWPSYNFRFTPGIPAAIAAGTYNVGIGQTYNSLTLAVADVNHRGITGSVTLNLTDAQYDTTTANGSNIFPIFVATPNADATNLLTISKTGTPATLAYRGSSISASGAGFGTGVSTTAIGHGTEPLLGVSASYTTISNLNLITHGAPQTVEIGLAVFELFGNKGAQNNLFDKISIDLNRTHGGVYGINSFSTTSPGGFPGTNSNNTFRDLNIKDCNFGISLSAPNNATGPADQGNKIITSSCSTYNYIGDPNVPDDIIGSGSYGVSIAGQYNFTVRNCIIQNITGTSSTVYDVDGIVVTNSWGDNEISNNIIHTLRRSSTGLNSAHWVSGIRLRYDNQTMSFKIFNNSISNLLSSYTGAPTTTAAVLGIYFQDNTGNVTSEVYNNSVSIDGSTFPNASSACLAINGIGESFQIKNNVFANYTTGQTGVAYHSCFYTNATAQYGGAGSLSDYNNYYLADLTNGSIGRAITTDYTTLAAWQAAMTVNPGTDANSLVANPNFVNNATDLHGTSASTSLDETGTAVPAYITNDIDCETRVAPSDIGFDDFTPGCPADGGNISPANATVCASTTYNMTSTGFSIGPNTIYQWMVSTTSGGPYNNVTGGSGANTTTYTTGSLTAGTKYFVLKTTCGNGGTDLSNQLVITVNALPNANITAGGATTFCKGGSVTLNAVVAANRSYQWKKGANNISGATLSSYTATTTGSYKVVVTNTVSGCTKASPSAIAVTATPLPAAVITPQGPLTFCAGDSVVLQASTGAGLTYKWKKGANFISGATSSVYTAKTAGTYRVEVTDNNGCSKLSATKTVTVNCRQQDGSIVAGLDVSVFPNPAMEVLNIALANEDDFEIEIENTLGEVILKTKNQNVIDISNLTNGIYFIKVYSDDNLFTQKFIKQ